MGGSTNIGYNVSTHAAAWRELPDPSLFTPLVPPHSCMHWPGAVAMRVAEDSSGFPCRIRLSNAELISHCRKLPRRRAIDLGQSRFTCPKPNHTEMQSDHVWDKYGLMHSGGWCDRSGDVRWSGLGVPYVGEWHRCTTIFAMIMLGVLPGDVVFDWGASCGHRLAFASQLFGAWGVGLDQQAESIAWANRHIPGQFCHGDGRDLTWLPHASLDGAISFASVFHLGNLEQCVMVVDLITKLRPGRIAWLGWNGPNIIDVMQALAKGRYMVPPENTWPPCFESAAEKLAAAGVFGLDVGYVDERELFVREEEQTPTVFLDLSAYSLFILRQSDRQERLVDRLGKHPDSNNFSPLFRRVFGEFPQVGFRYLYRRSFDRDELAEREEIQCGPFCGIHERRDDS